jgi:hypothetical protein
MAHRPYHIARQQHLGDTLDELARRGRLSWRWDYANRRAIYHVTLAGQSERQLDTRAAERVVQAECDALGIRWRPVPHPGGEDQLAVVHAWINDPNAP